MDVRPVLSARLRAALATAVALSLGALPLTGSVFPVSAEAAAAATGKPNRFDPASHATSVKRAAPLAPNATTGAPAQQAIVRDVQMPMQPGFVALDPLKPAQFIGSDNVLEVDVPVGAVSAADLSAAAGGKLYLAVKQVLPGSGSNAGGSGHISFGTFLAQVVDGSGKLVTRGLRQPLGFKLRYGSRGSALDVAHAVLTVNPPLPAWVDQSPPALTPSSPASAARIQAPRTSSGPSPKAGPLSRQRPALDAAAGTLSATVTPSGPSTSVSWDATSPVATFGKPDPFEASLSAGALSGRYPLDIPAGPGGLTPPLALVYDSSAVNDQHNPAGAAGWVGEGWGLTLGAISWAERKDTTCSGCGWVDTWQLSDAFGTSAELVPPSMSIKTYYDDNPVAISAQPITWHTAPETHAKVISFQAPFTLAGMADTPPCFRAFLPNGIMEEFGCTPTSLQYYPEPAGPNAGKDYIANWLLDLVTDPQGNQIHVTYQSDPEQGANGIQYWRDLVPATVEYDSPACHDAQNACTGAAWAPQVRVSFQVSHAVAHPVGPVCTQSGNVRCDDPSDLGGSNGFPQPTVESTLVLNDVLAQTRTGAGGAWNTLRSYRLGYGQTAGGQITDPFSGVAQGTAGSLLLKQMTEIGSDGVTALPTRSFDYQQVTNWYEDSYTVAKPLSTNCQPNNPPGANGCAGWSEGRAGNSYFLSQVGNGQGLSQTYTWALAHNNSHGPGGNTNPLYCNTVTEPSYPCQLADDQAWSRAVLASRTDSVVRPYLDSSGHPQSTTVSGVTSYSYQLTSPLPAQYCSDCVSGYVWGSQDDIDIDDFYNNRFMSFAQATVTKPDNATEVHKFYSTEGIGLYDTSQLTCSVHPPNPCHNAPWWDLANAAHGHEYEVDRYDTNGTTLLDRTLTIWQALCPPPGVLATPPLTNFGNFDGHLVSQLDYQNPVAVCDVQRVAIDHATYDSASGLAALSVPHQVTTYTYDGYGRETGERQTDVWALTDSSQHPISTPTWSGAVSFGQPGLLSNGDGGTALGFDGSTGRIATSYTQSAVTAYSVEAWIQTSDGGPNRAILQDRGAGPGQSLTLGLDFNTATATGPGDPFFALDSNGVAIGVWSSKAINDGRPHHLVGIWSGASGAAVTASQFALYVDGAAVAANALSFGSATAPLTGLGGTQIARSDAFNSNLGGTLEEVAIYSGALTPAQVASHYHAGTTSGVSYPQTVLNDGPQAYERLGDPVGGSSPNTIVRKAAYVWNDSVSMTSTSATGTYLIDFPAFSDVEDPAGNRYQCTYTTYDTYASNGWTIGASSNLTQGRKTVSTAYTGCGSAGNGFQPGGGLVTTYAYDTFGNLIGGDDPDANAGISGHTGCSVGGFGPLTTCTTYDATFGVLPATRANALNQVSTTGYQAPGGAGSVLDSGVNHLNATPTSGVGAQAPGLVSGLGDGAASFDGSGGQIVTGYTQSSVTSYSVEAWIQTTDGGPNRTILQDRGSGPGQSLTLGLNFNTATATGPGDPFFALDVDNVAIGVWSSKAVDDGKPHHLVGTWSGTSGAAVTASQFALYVDGAAVATNAFSFGLASAPLSGQGTAKIARSDVFNTNLGGTLGELAVYTRQLQPSQVQNHFKAGANYASVVQGDGPAAYYRLNDAFNGGFGLWPISQTDGNGQTTSTTYDALGRQTGQVLPGEAAGLTTLATAYTVWCSGTAAQAPCVEVDKTQRLNASTTVTDRAFYDGTGHMVETRSPAPGGQDVVQFMFYDPSQRLVFKSVPFFVAAYSGAAGAAAYSLPQTNPDGTTVQAGTTYTYDGLGRQTGVTDALSHKTTTARSVVCGAAGTSDIGWTCYEQTLTTDPNTHEKATLNDAFGRTAYEQRYQGNSNGYLLYATTRSTYDFVADLVQILHPDGSTKTSFAYDMAGRKTGMTDPDRGTETYNYDQNGNVTRSVDARGAAGTVFIGYDGLNRPKWHNTASSSGGAYDTFGYDSTANGNQGIGRLTSQGFTNGALAGSYANVYDARGRLTSLTESVGSASYQLQTGYDDAGNVLTQAYPTGEVVSTGYTPEGWLNSLATTQGVTTTSLLSVATYDPGKGGAFGELTAATLGGAYTYSASYDPLDRAIDLNWKHASTTVFDQTRTFDAAGNVSTIATTLSQGTDNQAFCYDEQDRLTWAGATGTPPCTGTAISAGSLSAAQYTQSFTYDNMGRLKSGPGGSYTYGDPAHAHGATALASGWTASYDAAGDMTCRAPTSATTCAGTPTGAQLGYGPEGTMTAWQDKPSSPGTTAAYLYDPQGQRVVQQVSQGGSTTTTVYVGDVEQVATTGSTATTTTYYYAAGKRIALAVNGTVSYLASDALGSASLALNPNGSATASQLFAPYGGVRYSSGTMPTDYGFTGERSDAATGLGYFGARYYDPVAGQFASADTLVTGGIFGLSRYAYVEGNPVDRTDRTGHKEDEGGGGGGCTNVDVCGGGGDGTGDPCLDEGICNGDGSGTGSGCTVSCGGGGTGGGGGGSGDRGDAGDLSPGQSDRDSGHNNRQPLGGGFQWISATCGMSDGLEVGSCTPTAGNYNYNPDFLYCIALRLCVMAPGASPESMDLSRWFMANSGVSDPEALADMAAGRAAAEDRAAGVAATEHGAQQLVERGLTADTVALTKTGETFRQADGAIAYLKQVGTGRYNVIVEGERGVITGLRNIRTSAVARLARRYGWDWIP